ncbi:MAG: SRPBCC family protein [Roseibium sp.]
MSARRIAKYILVANASTSGLSGIAMVLIPGLISNLLFAVPVQAHVIGTVLVGFGLLVFALDVAFIAKDQFLTAKDLYWISAADDVWVLASISALVFIPDQFTDMGWYAVALTAAGVGGYGFSQTIIGRKLAPPVSQFELTRSGDTLEISVRRRTNASSKTVWQVMTDHARYADVADNLSKVELIDGDGDGDGDGATARRKCYGPRGESWSETCDLYREGEVFGFEVHTEATDYPYPFTKVQGRWSVNEIEGGSEFLVEISVQPKNALTLWMMKTFGFRSIRALMINLADRWAERMELEDLDPEIRIAAE